MFFTHNVFVKPFLVELIIGRFLIQDFPQFVHLLCSVVDLVCHPRHVVVTHELVEIHVVLATGGVDQLLVVVVNIAESRDKVLQDVFAGAFGGRGGRATLAGPGTDGAGQLLADAHAGSSISAVTEVCVGVCYDGLASFLNVGRHISARAAPFLHKFNQNLFLSKQLIHCPFNKVSEARKVDVFLMQVSRIGLQNVFHIVVLFGHLVGGIVGDLLVVLPDSRLELRGWYGNHRR